MGRYRGITAVALAAWGVGVADADAQSLGTFRWQLQPYCNVVNVTVTQNGGLYTLDGYDDQCGAAERASVVGTAVPNPNGSVTLGFTIVTTPSGAPVHVQTAINLSNFGGTWSDSAGNTGTFVFTPGAGTGGSPRPAALAGIPDNSITSAKVLDGSIGGADVNATEVQMRVSSTCPSNQLMTGVNQDGTVVCQTVTSTSCGDISAVNAGLGLFGGGVQGDVTLNVVFQGPGTAAAAARSDHTHATGSAAQFNTKIGDAALPNTGGGVGNTALGALAMTSLTSTSGNTAVGAHALNAVTGDENTAVGGNAGRNTTGAKNTLLGWGAGQVTSTGGDNTFVGFRAGFTNTVGSSNTLLGSGADLASNNLSYATAIGALAEVAASNSLVLGRINGVNGALADTSVGIGTTSPNAALDIDSELVIRPTLRLTNTTGSVVVSTRTARGTRTAPAATQLNDVLFELRTNGHTGTDFTNGGRGNILVRATEDWTTTANGVAMDFFTTPNGSTNALQRMIITKDGEVAIGRTNPAQLLDVNGNVRIGTGTTGCVEDRDGSVIMGVCSSDARFKRDVTPFPDMLQRVAQLRPVSYFWRADEFPERHFGTSATAGLIAQDVETVFPDMVTTAADGFKAVNYSKLPLLTLQAVRELKEENDALKRELAALRSELEGLTRAVERR